MKGISYITDKKNHKTALVIDLKTIEQHDEKVHEFIDVLIAVSRKNDEAVSWETAKKHLRKKVSYELLGSHSNLKTRQSSLLNF